MIAPFNSLDKMPKLGFGCARLFGGPFKAQSMRLLAAAYEAGIRYFDTARLYADGDAESVLGEFLGRSRTEVIITSKAGILPAKVGRAQHYARRLAKFASRVTPIPPLQPQYGVFEISKLRQSIETSLRALRTDRLDGLLLHVVGSADLADGSVRSLLEKLQAAGVIGTYGSASTRAQTRDLVRTHGDWLPVVQTVNTVLEDELTWLRGYGNFFTITHSVLAGALDPIMRELAANPSFCQRWVRETGTNPNDRDVVAELLLAEALDAYREGIVLFSSTSPARIARAGQIACAQVYSVEQIKAVRSLASTLSRSVGVLPKLNWELNR